MFVDFVQMLSLSGEILIMQSGAVSVAAHLRGMRPAPTSKEDTLMLRRNSKTNTIDQTLNYLLLDYL